MRRVKSELPPERPLYHRRDCDFMETACLKNIIFTALIDHPEQTLSFTVPIYILFTCPVFGEWLTYYMPHNHPYIFNGTQRTNQDVVNLPRSTRKSIPTSVKNIARISHD